jgi:hypothetical protein
MSVQNTHVVKDGAIGVELTNSAKMPKSAMTELVSAL